MREIKFRAKSVHGSEWVYGNFIHSKRFAGCSNEFRIHDQETGLETDIVYDTLGQFTGLKDKNGVEIYEGDVVDIEWETYTTGGYFQSSDSYCKHSEVAEIVYHQFGFVHMLLNGKKTSVRKGAQITVIDNIHPNQDLLK